MVWFRENWYEELLRQLNEGLVMCQAVAFASRADGKPHNIRNITCYSLDHLHTLFILIFSFVMFSWFCDDGVCDCVCVCERERESVCVCERERLRERGVFCAVANAQIPSEMFQFVKRLVSTFGIGLEQSSGSGSSGTPGGGSGGPLSHESLAKRAQAAAQDPAFQRLKAQFASDFDFR